MGDRGFPTFDAESKFAKIPKSHDDTGGGIRGFQLLMLSPNLLKFQSPIMVRVVVVERVSDDQFQLLIPSPNLLKSQSLMMVMVGWGREVRIGDN